MFIIFKKQTIICPHCGTKTNYKKDICPECKVDFIKYVYNNINLKQKINFKTILAIMSEAIEFHGQYFLKDLSQTSFVDLNYAKLWILRDLLFKDLLLHWKCLKVLESDIADDKLFILLQCNIELRRRFYITNKIKKPKPCDIKVFYFINKLLEIKTNGMYKSIL